MLLTNEGKKEFLKTKFHQYFDITLDNDIVIQEDSIVQFVNFILPLSKINEYYDIQSLKPFLNSDYNNVIFTPYDNNNIIYDYEFYQGDYFIQMKPFSKTIRMHIIPKKYNASNTTSDHPILLFKNSQYDIDSDIFSCSSQYHRINSFKNINLYYDESTKQKSNGFYKFDIKDKTRDLNNLQINLGYAYNDTNPTNDIWHVTGIIDESNEQGEPISSDQYTSYNEALVDINGDNNLDYTNKIVQERIHNNQIDWDDLYVHEGGFNNPHSNIMPSNDVEQILNQFNEFSDDLYYLFRGDCWTINNNFESSAAIVSDDTDNFSVYGTFRTDSDLIGIYWYAQDLISHPYISYGERYDFTDVTLDFDYKMTGCRDWADDYNQTNHPCVITINQKNGDIHYVTLYQFIDNGHVHIDFNELYTSDNTHIPVSNIESIMFLIKPKILDAEYTGQYNIIDNVDFKCEVSNISVTNGDICNEHIQLEPHSYRLCEGYDDFYNLNPYRVCREMRKLGYVEWCDLYIGASHFYEKIANPDNIDNTIDTSSFTHTRTEKMVVDTSKPLNLAFEKWLSCYSRELLNNDCPNLIISVSMENLQCPASWRQKASNGDYAITGWVPSTFFYSPCNQEAISYMKQVSEACLDIVANNDMKPILQLGEAWWWWNENDKPNQPPCFYDDATQNQYMMEMGGSLPVYESSWATKFNTEVINWLNNQLVQYSDQLRSVVKSSKYKNGLYMALFFPPSVTDVDRVPKMMQQVNYLADAYNPDKLDILQLEDYDWVITNNPHHEEVYTIGEALGFDTQQLHYYGGFVQYPEDAIKLWKLIEDSMVTAQQNNFAEVFVWAGSQVRRDNKMIGYDIIDQSYLSENLYHKTLKYFNDDLYIEENEQYHIIDWNELTEE